MRHSKMAMEWRSASRKSGTSDRHSIEHSNGRRWRALALVSSASFLLLGCAVGPDFKRPPAPQATGYMPRQALPAASKMLHPQFDPARDISAAWWTVFGSPQLNTLIAKAFKASPTLEAAQAALRQAQENVYAQQGLFFPTVQASYSPQRIKMSGNTNGGPGVQGDGSTILTGGNGSAASGASAPYTTPVLYNWHSAQLTVGFVPDVFGGNRRQVESQQAQADTQYYQLEAAYITLASNLTAAAIQEASLRAQIEAAQKMVQANAESLTILHQQYKVGFASGLDVAGQEAALAQAQALLPPLQKQLEQTRDLIRILVGNTPDVDVAETFTLADLHLPADLPLSLPSQLVRQRPDVLAAEAQLHEASANVGVAEAARFPQFSINATLGGNAAHLSEMFMGAGKFFTVSGLVSQTLFEGGTLMHHERAADQALVQAQAQYRSTVLVAFQNVADTLHALDADARAAQAAARAEQAAKTSFDLVHKQTELGFVNGLALFAAEQNYEQALMASAQARANQLGDTAALFQALGGGWWNRVGADHDKAAQVLGQSPAAAAR